MKKLKIILIAAVVLIAAGFGAYGIYTQIDAVKFGEIVIDGIPEKDEAATRVMSFNVRCANDGKQTITNRSKVAVEVIKQYAPDSFGVQECTPRWCRILKSNLGDKYDCVGKPRDAKGPFTEYSSIYYLKDKYNLIDSGTFWLSETPDKPNSKSFDSACCRIATWAILENKTTGERYTHINTHLDHVLESTREAQMQVLIGRVLEITKDSTVVMTGDFNAYEDSSVYAVACESFNDTKYIAENSDNGPTFTKYGTKEDNGKGAIDFIFVTKDVKVQNYKIIRNTVQDIYPSDHFPIVADVFI
ncbi:MAG: endonuclease/exonuclease/phosphatase family protein [Clostridia bacterium]|nr:endonuclease/exonuclease/phosphatase family protein [Oscillospiraceae bacterium]MBQ7005863.1 endonuclease/exonuclease/phosphatase family protein [Clostridia bacterium]